MTPDRCRRWARGAVEPQSLRSSARRAQHGKPCGRSQHSSEHEQRERAVLAAFRVPLFGCRAEKRGAESQSKPHGRKNLRSSVRKRTRGELVIYPEGLRPSRRVGSRKEVLKKLKRKKLKVSRKRASSSGANESRWLTSKMLVEHARATSSSGRVQRQRAQPAVRVLACSARVR